MKAVAICIDSDTFSAGLDPVIALVSVSSAVISALTNPAVGNPAGVAAAPAAGVVGGAPELPLGRNASVSIVRNSSTVNVSPAIKKSPEICVYKYYI